MLSGAVYSFLVGIPEQEKGLQQPRIFSSPTPFYLLLHLISIIGYVRLASISRLEN